MNMEMREKLLEVLTEVCPGVEFEGSTTLIDDGVLESLDIVMIVAELNGVFQVEITVDDLLPDNFNSVDAMLALIESKR